MANNQRVGSVLTPIDVGLSTPKSNKNGQVVIDCLDGGDDDDDLVCWVNDNDDGTPLRPILCLKKRSALKDFEDKEDCFILDFNPEDDSFDPSKFSLNKDHQNNVDASPDILLVAEKGQVACRDYPHSRHLCVKHPFEKTPHESHCQLCYCYVCDVAAPCKLWSGMSGGHCHAIDTEGWKYVRDLAKQGKNP